MKVGWQTPAQMAQPDQQFGWGGFLADLKLFIPDQVQLNLFTFFEVY
jgi:hypothetical protein